MGEANEDGVARNSEFSEEELDLSLGLSLGGRYSQSPEEKPIIRTSSLNGDLAALNENDGGSGTFLSLARSSSLPTEAEQELTKLKEMQATKRMEAKKRLLEKHNKRGGGYTEEEKSPAVVEDKLTNWAIESAANNPAFRRAIEKMRSHVSPSGSQTIRGQGNSTAEKIRPNSQPRATENGKSVNPANPHRSEPVANFGAVANGNGKSAYPASHRSPPVFKLEKMANAKPANPHLSDSAVSLRKRANGKSVAEPAETEQERPSKKGKVPSAKGNHDDSTMEMMRRLMPSVTATGDGPNGRKIEGVLYKYVTERVRIVCVCHGRFLSPAEFVKHAGGTDVENPMKHISVLHGRKEGRKWGNPSSGL